MVLKQIITLSAVAFVVVLGAYLLVRPTAAPSTTPALEVTPSPALEGEVKTSPAAAPEAEATSPAAFEEEAATSEPEMIANEKTEELKVSLINLKFSPSSLTIKAGQSYKLTLTSKGPHTYTVDKLGINFAVDSGQTKTFDLKVTRKGTYDVYCATPGHQEGGMVGKLVVN